MSFTGLTLLDQTSKDYFRLKKFVAVDSFDVFSDGVPYGFFIHPETLHYPVYIGDIRGDTVMLISKDSVNPDDFPDAKCAYNLNPKIPGWNC